MPKATGATEMSDEANLNPGLFKVHLFFFFTYGILVLLWVIVAVHNVVTGSSGDQGSGGAGWFEKFGWLIYIAALLSFMVALHGYAAKGARVGNASARNISRVIAILLLVAFPIGTAVGVYMLFQVGKKWQGHPSRAR